LRVSMRIGIGGGTRAVRRWGKDIIQTLGLLVARVGGTQCRCAGEAQSWSAEPPYGGPRLPRDVHLDVLVARSSTALLRAKMPGGGNPLGWIRGLISPVPRNVPNEPHISSVLLLEKSYPRETHPADADAPGHCRRARAAGRKEEEQVCDPLIEVRHFAPDLDRDLDPIPTSTSHLTSSHLHTRQPAQRTGSDLTSSAECPTLSSPRLPTALSLHRASRPASRLPPPAYLASRRSRLDTDPFSYIA
jgi:hypothetical protein